MSLELFGYETGPKLEIILLALKGSTLMVIWACKNVQSINLLSFIFLQWRFRLFPFRLLCLPFLAKNPKYLDWLDV